MKCLGMPEIQPMVVAIWCGPTSKPSNCNEYLRKFVTELNELLEQGLLINDHHINVSFRCFLCDTPARAFIKGMKYIYLNRRNTKFKLASVFLYILEYFLLP